MFVNQSENFKSRFLQSLSRPIQRRCAELTVLFDRGTIADLYAIYPLLIDDIFKPNSGVGCWELRRTSNSSNMQDFYALQHFLCPTGPVFKLIYNLTRDLTIKFPFSLSYLPSKVFNSIVGPNRHPYYMDLVQEESQSNRVVSLMLNPFDYYIFHFAYHLINPRCHPMGTVWNTVYYMLCCDYILYFLPTDPSQQIFPPLDYFNGKNPSYKLPSFNKSPTISQLLRKEMVNVNNIQPLECHPRNKIWRSETLMIVFIDFWMSNDQVLNDSYSFEKNFSMISSQQKLKVNELPTGEYVRIVRVLVKQLHCFSSSAGADDTPMVELKKIVIPYLQGRMYIFLRHLIHRWPLDGSFRLVLELWVSFLQPWRYIGSTFKNISQRYEVNPDVEDTTVAPMKAVDPTYKSFLAENLLCYTVLFQQLLPRFTRVDISSPKIALILFRLTKVFSQPNLVDYLREIEIAIGSVDCSRLQTFKGNMFASTSLPPLSATSAWSSSNSGSFGSLHSGNMRTNFDNSNIANDSFYNCDSIQGKWTNTVRQKIVEYEESNFTYKPLFNSTTASEVYELAAHIKCALEISKARLNQKLNDSNAQISKSFFSKLLSFFMLSESTIEEFTMEECEKVPIYLDAAYNNLKTMFLIDESCINKQTFPSEYPAPSFSIQGQSDLNTYLSPNRVRERVLNSKYEGNPDLVPIRTDEVGFLVRMLYLLSLKLNEKYSEIFQRIYHERNFFGRMSRQLLCPPCTYYKYDKFNTHVSPRRVEERLPVRVSLRYFASYRFILYFIITVILGKLLGYGYFAFPFCIFVLWFVFICFYALFENRSSGRANVPSANVFSTSMEDSFN